MEDRPDDLPDEVMEVLETWEESDATISDLLMIQIEALIDEAEELWARKRDEAEHEMEVNPYSEPYESGPAMLWRLIDNKGIDSHSVTWWLAALGLEDDHSPYYLIHDRYDQLTIRKLEWGELSNLADGFRASEDHCLQERIEKQDEELDTALPAPSEIPPPQPSDGNWEYVVNPDQKQSGDPTLIIRRAPVLDHGTLGTYVLEARNQPDTTDDQPAIGTFWGHHGWLIGERLEKAITRLSENR